MCVHTYSTYMFIFIKNLVTVETAATRTNRLRIQPLDARVGAMATKSSPWLWALTGSECGNEFQGHLKTNPAGQKYLGFQGLQHCPAFNNGEMHKILGSRFA